MHTTGIHKRWIISVVIVTSWLASADAATEFGLYEHNETHSLVHTKSTELGHHADVYVPNEAAGYLSLPVQSKSDLHLDEEDVAQENPVQEDITSTGSVQSPVLPSAEGNAGSENYMAQTGEDKASPEAFSSGVDDASSSAVDGKRVASLDVEASSTEQDGQSSAEAQALETQASGGSTMSDSVTSEVSKHDGISPTVSAIGMISNEDPDSVLATTDDMSFTKASQDSPEQTKEGLPASIDEDSPASNKEDPSVVTKEESSETANKDTLASGEVNLTEDIEEDLQAPVNAHTSVDTSDENDATVSGEKTDLAAARAAVSALPSSSPENPPMDSPATNTSPVPGDNTYDADDSLEEPDTKLENSELKTSQPQLNPEEHVNKEDTGEEQSDEQHEQPDDEQTDDDTQDDATDDEPQDDDTEDDYTEDDDTRNGYTKDSTEEDVEKDDHTKGDSTKVDDTNDDEDDDDDDDKHNTDDDEEPKKDASIASSSSEEEDAEDAEDSKTSAAGPGWRPPPVVNGSVLESTDGSSWDATDQARQQGVTTFALVMCAAVGATFIVLVAVWINRMRHQQRLQNLEDPDDEEFTVFSASDTRYIANSRGEYAPLR